MRRLKILPISGFALSKLFRTGLKCLEIEQGVPEDAEIVDARWNSISQAVELIFESKSFDCVEPGDLPSYHSPMIAKIGPCETEAPKRDRK